jgi:hypothetical protein
VPSATPPGASATPLGVAHAALSGGVLVTVLLPTVDPRMGTPWSDAEETSPLEPPGFMLVN